MSIAVSPGSQVGVVPVLRYRDMEEAVSWLCRAFGFEESRFVKDAAGRARYAQLACGDSMIMLCPLGGSAFDACMAQPADTGGCETQIAYVHVPDVEAHKARAVEAGAEIVLDMVGGDGRGQGYSCRDLEGHIWSFGTYDPWRHTRQQAPSAHEPDSAAPARRGIRAGAFGFAIAAVLAAAYLHFDGAASRVASSLSNIENVLEKPADLEAAEKMLRQAREELVRERALRMQAERQTQEQKDLAARDRAGNEKAMNEVRKALAEKTDLLAKAEKAAADAQAPRFEGPVAALSPAVSPQPVIKACDTEAEAKTIRTASFSPTSNDEVSALRAAMERAQAELTQERQNRALRATSLNDLRAQLDRERTARERAEKQVRETLARLARLDPPRKPETVPKDDFAYRDMSREIFPLSSIPR